MHDEPYVVTERGDPRDRIANQRPIQFVNAIRAGDARALEAVGRLLNDMRHIEDISDRELEVLELMSRGCNAKEAGRVLFVEESTIVSSMKRTRRKLGARNTAHAVAIALREGMIK